MEKPTWITDGQCNDCGRDYRDDGPLPYQCANDCPGEMLRQAAPRLLKWIARCAHMRGPADTKAYFISDEVMDEIRRLT